MLGAFYAFEPDAGNGAVLAYNEGDGAAAYPYEPPSRYAVDSRGGLVDAVIRAVPQRDAGEPSAFTRIGQIFFRAIGVNNTASNVAGLEEVYEQGTVRVHTPDSGGMIGYGPSVREARPGTFADHSRPTFNVALNKRLLTNRAGLLGWHGTSGAGEAQRVEANRHYAAQRPMGIWGRVTSWPKAVQTFRPFNKGDQ